MSNILLLMSGSIACEKASGLIPAWQENGDVVRVILTASAQHFISVATALELGAESVYTDTFAENELMEHIDLGHWADTIVIAPASANTINKLAAGIADDMLSTTLLAAYGLGKPIVVAPSMNSRMLEHPATQLNLKTLQSWGYQVLETVSGELACGESGPGRLMEVTDLLKNVAQTSMLKNKNALAVKGNVLITVGGTREAIDSVRYLGNGSSGRTASIIADYLSQAGYTVTALCAESAIKPKLASVISFVSFADLAQQLKFQLSSHSYFAVIHPAAVSDFSVESLEDGNHCALTEEGGKLSSDSGLVIRLKPNPKLLSQLRDWSKNPKIKVVGFKLTDSNLHSKQLQAVTKLQSQDSIDAVVHNDMSEITADHHLFHFYSDMGVADMNGAHELTVYLQQWMEDKA